MPAARATRKTVPPKAAALLDWYDIHRRDLPWRARRGYRADPYRVWLSEIMLQQTTVAAVGPYYRKFVARWPTVQALAASSLDEVLAAWSGLGYYARARNLHKAANTVVAEHSGRFPSTASELASLPGIGFYTAGAIAAIAFDRCEAAIDANAERVIARCFGIEEPLPSSKRQIREAGVALVPRDRPGDFAQALMDLGAAVCSPKTPSCNLCPWQRCCVAHRLGVEEELPRKAAARGKPLRRGAAFVARNARGAVLLVRRAPNGLLGSMMQPPLGPWADRFPEVDEAIRQAPFKASWRKRAGVVHHGFTHFDLEIETYLADDLVRATCEDEVWVVPEKFHEVALPTVMRKIIDHALGRDVPRRTRRGPRAAAA